MLIVVVTIIVTLVTIRSRKLTLVFVPSVWFRPPPTSECLTSAFSDLAWACSMTMEISLTLANRINKAKLPCYYHENYRHGCLNGDKCCFRHYDTIAGPDFEVPYVSVHRTVVSGKSIVNIRPPLNEAFKMYFDEQECLLTRGVGQRKLLTQDISMFDLPMMIEKDPDAIDTAKLRCYVQLSNGRQCGELGERRLPKILMHGTTAANALQIICDGATKPKVGKCGTGVLSLACPSYEDDDLIATFHRLFKHGLDCEAVFLCEPDGILIRAKPNEEVPPGATSFRAGIKGDETSHLYSSHPHVLNYTLVMFATAKLIPCLSVQLERLGYTEALHLCLLDAATAIVMDRRPADDGVNYVEITNPVIPLVCYWGSPV